MAIFGKLTDLHKLLKNINELDIIFNYFMLAIEGNTKINARICSMNCNQHKITKITDDIFAIEQSYETKKSSDLFFESHIKYIDFQLMISGEEIIKVVHTDLLEVGSEYTEEGDYYLYNTRPASSKINMQKNDLSIFFSKDAHMPGIQSSETSQQVFKTVVKVPFQYLNDNYRSTMLDEGNLI